MKSLRILLFGLVVALSATACTTNILPAADTAGFVHSTLTPSLAVPSSTPTPPPTVLPTQSPTAAPSRTSSPTTVSLSPTPTPLPACLFQPGTLESRVLEDERLRKPLEYIVYLPPCYAEEAARRYPAAYLFHGQTYPNTHWLDLGAGTLADHLFALGELPPFIMVFPFDRDHFTPPTGNAFGEVVISALIPAVEAEFRVLPDRQHRVIGGISRGGNWAAHLALQHPDLFSAVGLHSTPVFSTDTNQEIREWLHAVPVDQLPRIYMDAGENDRWLPFTLIFEAVLDDESIPHQWHLYPGFHEDAYWESHLEQYLRWYTTGWARE